MRVILAILVASVTAACASAPPVAPREYLDERTAATITVVAQPWIFANERSATGGERDFLSVHAIDVNRMGDHRQYLAVLQWWPAPATSANASSPALELQSPERTLRLQATTMSARDLGIEQPVASAYSAASKWWYFPVDKQTLAAMAQSQEWRATLSFGEERIAYIKWRDGRAELAELSDALQ